MQARKAMKWEKFVRLTLSILFGFLMVVLLLFLLFLLRYHMV